MTMAASGGVGVWVFLDYFSNVMLFNGKIIIFSEDT